MILLDIEKQKINLYKKDGLIEIPFQKATELYKFLESNNVLYITNAVETTAQEVINLIKSTGVSIEKMPDTTGIQYLHASGEETLYINEFLKFEGKYDIKLIDEEMKQTIEQIPLLKHLVNNKKLEIINSFQRKKLLQEYEAIQDKKVGSILIQDSVDDFLEGKTSRDAHSDAVAIDLESKGSAVEGGNINTMSELLDEMEEI